MGQEIQEEGASLWTGGGHVEFMFISQLESLHISSTFLQPRTQSRYAATGRFLLLFYSSL